MVSGLEQDCRAAADEGRLDRGDGPGCGPRRWSRLEVIADTFLSMNAPVQGAMPAWIAGREKIQQQILQRVAANLAELDGSL